MRAPRTSVAAVSARVRFAAALLVFAIWTTTAQAVAPLHHSHTLVAGQGDQGMVDGSFVEARFLLPAGLAQSPDGQRLYVADRGNHRIRVVDLDRDNAVSTLCGEDVAGVEDGTFAAARFRRPHSLQFLDAETLLVIDDDGASFRRIDLATRQVTTVAVTGEAGIAVPLRGQGVHSTAWEPKAGRLYFSEPALGRVSYWDPARAVVKLVVSGEENLPQPGPLAIHAGAVVVADLKSPGIFSIDEAPSGGGAKLTPISYAGPARALGAHGESFYALREQPPLWVRLPSGESVDLRSVRGGSILDDASGGAAMLSDSPGTPAGFVADVREEGHFFVSSAQLQSIFSLRDRRAESVVVTGANAPYLVNGWYPAAKPPGVFRILLVGDSRAFHPAEAEPIDPMMAVGAQLELELNTRSALEKRSSRFEVLVQARTSWYPLTLWPRYSTPPVVAAYDIDLVVIGAFPYLHYVPYFQRPLTAEGIPAAEHDPEFGLRPLWERQTGAEQRAILARAKELNWLMEQGTSGFEIGGPGGDYLSDPELARLFRSLTGRPMELLGKALRSGTAATSARGVVIFSPYAALRRDRSVEGYRALWVHLAERAAFSLIDLSDSLRVVLPIYLPLANAANNYHFFPQGHALYAKLVANALYREGYLEFPAR